MNDRTHYIPMFTRVDRIVVRHDGQGRRQTVCGAWAWPEQHKIDPEELTCRGCRQWMEGLNLIESDTTPAMRTA